MIVSNQLGRIVLKILKTYGATGLLKLGYSLFCTKLFDRPARLIRRPVYIRGRSGMIWGEGFTTGVGVRLDAFGAKQPVLVIGRRVQLNDYVHIGAVESVEIGDDVLIASRVFITDHNHGEYQGSSAHSSPYINPAGRPIVSRPVKIGDRAWIGENVSILPGVTIGEGAIIGAGSVVTRDVPPATIAAGCPARVIKKFDVQQNTWVAV